MPDSTRQTSRRKSPRKKPVFPLWLHSTGQWCKKVKGRFYYFGTDRDVALAEYLRVKDDLAAGRTPKPADADGLTLLTLCSRFLTDKKSARDAGEITPRSFNDYYATCELMLAQLGKSSVVSEIRPDDLMTFRRWLSKKRNATTLGNEITRVRVVLNYAFDNGLIDRPMRYGGFKRPAQHVLRRQKAQNGSKLFEPEILRKVIDGASPQLRAMILLGINCGLGNTDCAKLEFRHLDLKNGWINYPRPKTGIERRCPLWPETTEAIKTWLELRQPPHDEQHKNLIFLTRCHGPWYDDSTRNPISAEVRKLLQTLKLYRPGLSFYALRHTFQTIGDELGDYLATRRIMGHADNSMGGIYRERFLDERLTRVADHVHDWLFVANKQDKQNGQRRKI